MSKIEEGITGKTAIMSDCKKYRYVLTRLVNPKRVGVCLFIMLNPSTADAIDDDPTTKKCMGFAKNWGYGQLAIVNLFGFRATDPEDLKNPTDDEGNPIVIDPIGLENDHWVERLAQGSQVVVCAWGTHGSFKNRSQIISDFLISKNIQLWALKITKDGHPNHPLFLPGNTKLLKYEP